MRIDQYPANSSLALVKNVTDNYTLLPSDNGILLVVTKGSAVTVTVPASLPIGYNILILQNGAGQITLAASGTTILNRQSFTKSAGQYAIITLISNATNNFVASGDMAV